MDPEAINGMPVTDAQLRQWSDEAEAGYESLRRRGRPTLGSGPGQVFPVRLDASTLQALTERGA